jgi:hypothetical protein
MNAAIRSKTKSETPTPTLALSVTETGKRPGGFGVDVGEVLIEVVELVVWLIEAVLEAVLEAVVEAVVVADKRQTVGFPLLGKTVKTPLSGSPRCGPGTVAPSRKKQSVPVVTSLSSHLCHIVSERNIDTTEGTPGPGSFIYYKLAQGV